MSDSFNCKKNGATDQLIVACHKSALFLLQPIPKDTLVIRTYIHQMHLHFLAQDFWLEYNLWEKKFVQNLTDPAFTSLRTDGLTKNALLYMVRQKGIRRVLLLDDYYEEDGRLFPAESYTQYMYFLNWLEQNQVNLGVIMVG